ncbi:MAG: hypothetical protein M0Z95_28200 [Actinomycetota bacterium]|nr:hypothetical protein [Actinomycetota bacterium]
MTAPTIYEYVPHERTQTKLGGAGSPREAGSGRPRATPVLVRFNAWLAVRVTNGVGTMWCAYAFAALALVSLPSAIDAHSAVVLVSWISQTFLQLVLLSVVLVGQNILASEAERRADATSRDADAVLHEAFKLQEHLGAQDHVLRELVDRLASVEGRLAT